MLLATSPLHATPEIMGAHILSNIYVYTLFLHGFIVNLLLPCRDIREFSHQTNSSMTFAILLFNHTANFQFSCVAAPLAFSLLITQANRKDYEFSFLGGPTLNLSAQIVYWMHVYIVGDGQGDLSLLLKPFIENMERR